MNSMKPEDLYSFAQPENPPILLNPEGTTIADVQFTINLGPIQPGPIPKEVAMKKNFETSDSYVLEYQPKKGEFVRVRSICSFIVLFTL
jgi:hypothetical protein